MSDISQRPALHEKVVEQAHETMRMGHSLRDHPLLFFLSITNRLNAPHILSGPAAVQIAVFEHLSDIILKRLTDLREQYQLERPERRCALNQIRADFRLDNAELEAWSLLYYRYVCVDQNLTIQRIAELTNQVERTLRRRQQLGIHRLTLALVSMEQEARRVARQQRLRLALPQLHIPQLFGRTSIVETARHILTTSDPPRHLMLHGPEGIGKTTIALALAHMMVDAELIDDLLWIKVSNVSPTQTALLLEIITRLNLSASASSTLDQTLRAYLLTHSVLVVLDQAEALLGNTAETETLLNTLDLACVICTSQVKPPDQLWFYYIDIPELNQEQAFQLLDKVAERQGETRSDFEQVFAQLWKVVGGNPLALTMLFNAARNRPILSVLKSSPLDVFHHQIWDELSVEERRILLLPLLFQHHTIAYELISDLLASPDEAVVLSVLESLVRRALLMVHHTPSTTMYSLHSVTATFLTAHAELMIQHGESVLLFWEKVIPRHLDQLTRSPDAFSALSLLQLAQHLTMPFEQRCDYARQLAPQIMEAGLWAGWLDQLESLSSLHGAASRDWLNQMTGIALRWTGRLTEAKVILQNSLNGSEPAATLIELAVVFRYLGELSEAQDLAVQSLEQFRAGGSAHGVERCIHELAQLVLEAQNPEQALAWLSRLEHWSARAWGVASQAYLYMGEYQAALDAVNHALDLIPVQHPNQGRALATLGQIYEALGQPDAAADYLSLALDIFDKAKDMVGYARACNNFAVVVYRQSPSSTDARYLLQRALQIQELIGDRIGLAHTRQNLQWIQDEIED